MEREEMIKQTAQLDRLHRPITEIWLEQEPGSGGTVAAQSSSAAVQAATAKRGLWKPILAAAILVIALFAFPRREK